MSLLLRPSKCLRYLVRAGTSRGLTVPTARSLRSVSLCNDNHRQAGWSRNYSTRQQNSLQPLLSRLDDEVRRFGRISRKDIEELLVGVRALDLTSAQSLLVLRCCGELVPEELPEKRTQLVQQVWSVLNDRNVPLDVSHYNALLRVYLENEHQFSPAEFLDEMEKKGIQPNRVTYQRLMWRYCQGGDVDGATRILEKMRELGLPVSEPVLNALVMGHAFHGDAEGARAVLDTMAGAGLQPSGRTYCLLASGHARNGDVQGARDVLKLAGERDVYMSDKDLLDVVESLAIGGCTDSLDSFLELMQKVSGYNQDALNVILRLINRGLDDAAFKILKTMNEVKSLDNKESAPYRGAFFVKQLVNAGRSAEQIIAICDKLQDDNLSPFSLTMATGAVLQLGDIDRGKHLISHMNKSGLPVRHHYYWPLLVAAGREGNEEVLIDLLRTMVAEQLTPNVETLQDYVIPYLLKNNKTDMALFKLQGANIPAPKAARSILLDLLTKGEMQEAVRIAVQYRLRGYVPVVTQPLLSCLGKTRDIEGFVKILHVIADNQSNQDDLEQEGEKDRDNRGDISYAVSGAVRTLKNVNDIENLFALLIERGVGVNNLAAKRIEEYLGEKMTAGIAEKLGKLSSDDLETAPLERANRPRGPAQLEAPRLEALLARTREQGNPTANLNRQLLQAYVEMKDENKLTALLTRLESEQYVLTGTALAQLIEFYSEVDVETAMKYYKQLLEREPDFVLNRFKTMKLVLAMVKADKFETALEILKANKNEYDVESYAYNSLCWQVLNHLAENKTKTEVRTMLDTMIEGNYAEPSNGLLGSLVKTHMLKDDLDGALAEVEHCCEKYRCTPWKGELLRRLIKLEDANRLQRLTDLSTAVHGEVNSLYDLVLAFVECGRLRQARRVLETPGLRTRNNRLSHAAHRYMQEGRTECLEGLVEATKELSHIDRSEMFYNLLVSYCKAEATDKALGLWTQLQEQDEVPTEAFLLYLGNYLRHRNLPIPFVVPEPKSTATQPIKETVAKEKTRQETPQKKVETVQNPAVLELLKAIKNGTSEDIFKVIDMPDNNLSRNNYADALDGLMQKGNLEEAVRGYEIIMGKGILPVARVLRTLLSKCADSGDAALFERVGAKLDEKQKLQLQYDSKVTRLHMASGSDGSEHLSAMLSRLETAETLEQVIEVVRAFPRGATLTKVLADPQMKSLCDKIVTISSEKGSPLAANMVWQELVLAGKDAEARALWEKHIREARSFLFRRVLQEARTRKDPHLPQLLIDHMKEHKSTTKGALALVYSILLDYQTDVEPALNGLRSALESGVELVDLDNKVLKKLRDNVVQSGKEFPYEIPTKTKKN